MMYLAAFLLCLGTHTVRAACTPAAWGATTQLAVENKELCVTVTVPADFTDPTPAALGRFFPESASWCFAFVESGSPAPSPCKTLREFSTTLATRAGSVIDVYAFTDSGTFTTFTVGVAAEVTPEHPGISEFDMDLVFAPRAACTPADWGATTSMSVANREVCVTVTVPADFTAQTPAALGRFFPESASWCFAFVESGNPAPSPCKTVREFSTTLATRAGSVIDVYAFTDSGSFTTFTVGVPPAMTLSAAAACTAADWGATTQLAVENKEVCVTVSVPADFTMETPVALGRFFPESASWCFTFVETGQPAPARCTVQREFSSTLDTRAGAVIDVYAFTDTGSFTTFTVGVPPSMVMIPNPMMVM